jgi:hypothetical protein
VTSLFHRALRPADVEAEGYVFESMPHALCNDFVLPAAQETHEVIVHDLPAPARRRRVLTPICRPTGDRGAPSAP